MEKLLNFIKMVGAVMYDLYITNKRWMYVIGGGFIMSVMMAVLTYCTSHAPLSSQCCYGATVATLITIVVAECKDMTYGGKLDWKDINAGMLVPILVDLAACVMLIFGK